jgi:hypothetical protein
MRPFMLKELQARAQAIGAEDLGNRTMEFWVEKFGPTAAAWLIWSQRRVFLRDGVVDFKIPRANPTPSWFRVAFETLKRRHNWSATMIGNDQSILRVYRVRWHKWRSQRHPEAAPTLQPKDSVDV